MQFIEKRLKWLQIPDLPIILCVGYALFFISMVTGFVDPSSIHLCGNYIIEKKEYWRLFTFIFNINTTPIFFIFAIAMQWLFGSALEQTYGSSRFTLFFLVSWLIAVTFALIFPDVHFLSETFSQCVFFAFALIFPDFTLMLFFVIPIKIKWLALLDILFITYYIVKFRFSSQFVLPALIILLPILIFFGKEIYYKIRYRTRKTIVTAKKQVATKKPHHQCIECKVTDLMDPKKEFRYIEENNQTKCYCDAHFPTKKTSLGH